MKKIISLIAIVLFSFSSIAQDLSDQFYSRLGYSSPSWTQYGMEKNDFSDISKIGATFELGSIFMLKSILKNENMSFGINATICMQLMGTFHKNYSNLILIKVLLELVRN